MYLLKDVDGRGRRQPRAARAARRVRVQGRAVSDVAATCSPPARRGRAGAPAADHRSVREDHALRPEGDRRAQAAARPTASGTSRSTSKRASSTPTRRAARPKRRSTSRSTSACSPPSRATKDFDRGDVLAVRAPAACAPAQQTLQLVVDREPKFAGVDPYNKRVDRNSDDNLRAIDPSSLISWRGFLRVFESSWLPLNLSFSCFRGSVL